MTYNHVVSRELKGNLKYRKWILSKCRTEPKYRKAVMLMCSRDPIYWINAFVMQFNPNRIGSELKVGPFILRDFQEEAIHVILEQIRERNDLCVEKSREMGATWIFLIIMVWFWLFSERDKFLMVSRSAEAVDNPDDPDCLFWKIDFILEHLPKWMKPVIERGKDRQMMKLSNRKNGSVITGQASTGKAGVGGRATAMFVDEFTQIKEDFAVLQRTADTTRCRLFNFTHTGMDTAGYTLTEQIGVRKLRMHWSMHPEKGKGLYSYDTDAKQLVFHDDYEFPPDYDFVRTGLPSGPFAGLRSPWYDRECTRRNNSREVAMDLDIDPKGSSAQFFEPLDIKRLVLTYAKPPIWEGDLTYDRTEAKPIELLKRQGGPLKLWFLPDFDDKPPKGWYVVGSDISGGVGTTPSCLSIFNGRLGEKFGEYSNAHIYPDAFASFTVALCRLFKNPEGDGAQLIWEAQGPGGVFGKQVLEHGYRNVWFNRNEFELNGRVSDKPGWTVNDRTKRLMLEEYKSGLLSAMCLNRSRFALEQCLEYSYKNKTIEHGKSRNQQDPAGSGENHGDMVIADGLAWKLAKGLVDSRVEVERQEVPVGTLLWRRRMATSQSADSYY